MDFWQESQRNPLQRADIVTWDFRDEKKPVVKKDPEANKVPMRRLWGGSELTAKMTGKNGGITRAEIRTYFPFQISSWASLMTFPRWSTLALVRNRHSANARWMNKGTRKKSHQWKWYYSSDVSDDLILLLPGLDKTDNDSLTLRYHNAFSEFQSSKRSRCLKLGPGPAVSVSPWSAGGTQYLSSQPHLTNGHLPEQGSEAVLRYIGVSSTAPTQWFLNTGFCSSYEESLRLRILYF